MHCFQGLLNVDRQFISKFSRLGMPLNQKLEKRASQEFEPYDRERRTVDILMENLNTLPALALPQLNGQYIIDTDASDTQMDYDLLQEQKVKVLKPIGFWFCSFCDAKTRYSSAYN